MSTQFGLLQSRRFLPLFLTQFLGAFNDNLFKNALIVLLTFQAASWTTLKIEVLTNLAAGIFILPFFLFSATAGQLADKYDKAALTRLVKLLEMGIMAVAGLGFWLQSLGVLLTALFLLGCHSTLFGPVKYALLPQHLREEELVGGNAWVEAGTFMAILIGTLSGGLLAGAVTHPVWIAFGGLIVALAGYGASRFILPAPAPAPALRINPNPFTETWRNIALARENRGVFLAILGISWFWLYGALLLAQFPAYAKNILAGDESLVTLLLATFTLGIGAGSLLCERLSGQSVEIGLVPLGSIGLTLFGLDLALASPTGLSASAPLALSTLLGQFSTWRIMTDLLLLGLFGGLFIVPLYTLVQLRSPTAHRARIIAGNNILNALFMVAGALAAASLLGAGLSIPQLFALAALANAFVALYIFTLVPEFLFRFLAWLLAHGVYKLQTSGPGQIPSTGPALLVCDQSGIGGMVKLLAAAPRPVRLVLTHHSGVLQAALLCCRGALALDAHLPGNGNAPSPQILNLASQHLAEGGLLVLFWNPASGQKNDSQALVAALLTHLQATQPAPILPVVIQEPGGWRTGPGLRPRVVLTIGAALAPEQTDLTSLRTALLRQREEAIFTA